MATVSFEDFYEVPKLNFDISKLRRDLDKILLKKNEYIFHAGTCNINSKIYSNGGRVLNFVIVSKKFEQSRDEAINLINRINWSNGFYRKDIGYKVIIK